MKLVAALAPLVAIAACVAPRTVPSERSMTAPTTVKVRTAGRVVTVPLEAYVLGSVLAEVSPVNETPEVATRIFALQSVLARTYALAHLGRHAKEGFDLCDSSHCQLYEPARIGTSRFTELARRAVAERQAVVLLYQGRPADAVYHADCGGHTASADEVWGGTPVAYLSGAKDEVPSLAHRGWEFTTSIAKIRTALEADPRTAVGSRFDGLSVRHRDESGRADLVDLKGRKTVTVRGDVLRGVMTRAFGDRSVMSTRFSVARQGQQIRFTGTGFGHGVGLCQVGAAARARRGTALEMIVAAYFPGTTLTAFRADLRAQGMLAGLIRSP